MKRARGFTLMELVVAITISAIVIIFVSMFIAAPVDAYSAHAQRNTLVADAAAAWPRMEADLRQALPNSARTRRNGNFVVLEMLEVVDEARYMTAPAASFNVAGVFRGIALPFNSNTHYLSVNNTGLAGANAYALSGSITPAGATIQIAAGLPGEAVVTVNPVPVFAADSPRHRIYLVSGPVTYLCDETQGTLRRYANYPIAANQAARDAPADFAGLGTLIAQGISACNFAVSAVGSLQSQTVSAQLTTSRNTESVRLLHASRAQYVP